MMTMDKYRTNIGLVLYFGGDGGDDAGGNILRSAGAIYSNDRDAGGTDGRDEISNTGIVHIYLLLPDLGTVIRAATRGKTDEKL